MDASQALLKVIEYLVFKDLVLAVMYAGVVYLLVFVLYRRTSGSGSGGTVVVPTQPPGPVVVPPVVVPPVTVPPGTHPELSLGDSGPDVTTLQGLLGVTADGEFGPDTDAAVRSYQATHGLDVDGDVGDATWNALLTHAPATAAAPGIAIGTDVINAIVQAAGASALLHYSWAGRGVAPAGYIKGLAVAYGNVYAKWKAGSSATQVMATALGPASTDALQWYAAPFSALGMSNTASADILRHTFVLLCGLGMRESSGRYCEGRDTFASNITADTAEAGLFQQSWNSSTASPELSKLFASWSANPQDFLSIFSEGVTPNAGDLTNYGSGTGAAFQALCKSCPAFAVEMAAVGLRVLRQHWGPINRQEAELRPEADQLFQQVQTIVDASLLLATIPAPAPPAPAPAPAPTAPGGIPAWITLGRSFDGLVWNGGPMPAKIVAWLDHIAATFPEMKKYCDGLKNAGASSYWEWCGLFVAAMLSYSGIRPPIDAAGLATGEETTGSFAYVDSWRSWGTKVWDTADGDISNVQPQIGDVLIWYRAGVIHHVSFYDHPQPTTSTFASLGGDQSKPLRVCISNIDESYCVAIRRPIVPALKLAA